MKKFLSLVALAAALVVIPTVASAQAQVLALAKLKWVRGISSYGLGAQDSTRISIPAAAAAADMADTTIWFDLAPYKLSQDYAKQPQLWFQINKQLTTTTDSIGVQLHYTNDIGGTGNQKLVVATGYLTTVAAATAGLSAGDDGIAGTWVAVSADANAAHIAGVAAAMPWRFVRLVIYNADTSGATGRCYFSVQPVVYGSRP